MEANNEENNAATVAAPAPRLLFRSTSNTALNEIIDFSDVFDGKYLTIFISLSLYSYLSF